MERLQELRRPCALSGRGNEDRATGLGVTEMILKIPEDVQEVALFLFQEGYHYSEAYPLQKWARRGWPSDVTFMRLVDSCLKILWTLERANPTKPGPVR